MKNVIAVLATSLIFSANPALANDSDDGFEPTVYAFDDEFVGGDTVGSKGEILLTRRGFDRESLVRIRQHFIPELLKSIEQL